MGCAARTVEETTYSPTYMLVTFSIDYLVRSRIGRHTEVEKVLSLHNSFSVSDLLAYFFPYCIAVEMSFPAF